MLGHNSHAHLPVFRLIVEASVDADDAILINNEHIAAWREPYYPVSDLSYEVCISSYSLTHRGAYSGILNNGNNVMRYGKLMVS